MFKIFVLSRCGRPLITRWAATTGFLVIDSFLLSYIGGFRLGFCVFKIMPQNYHSRMFLAGVEDEQATWIPDKGIRV